jgi:thioesterase domain-containing protein
VLPPKRPDLRVVSNAPQSTWRYEFYATYALPAHIDKLQPFVAPSAIDSTIIGRTTPLPDKPRQSISKLSAKGDDRLSYVVSLGTALPRKLEECIVSEVTVVMRQDADCTDGIVVECEGKAVMNHAAGNARIVRLSSGCSGPCLFLVPGTGGRIEGFSDLAASLRIPMPVFAIEPRGLDASSTPDTSVEEMARHYLTRIRTVQAAGPYFLAGHSFGGLVVFEMAQRLSEANEKVACLILLDTPPSQRYWPLTFYLRNLKARLYRHLNGILTISVRENLKFYFRRLLLREAALKRMSPDVMIGSNVARVLIAHGIARERYSPKLYSGKLTFFCASEGNNYDRLWSNRVHELEIHPAAGGHMSMIDPPNASSLASDISACLTKALAATTPAPLSQLDWLRWKTRNLKADENPSDVRYD